MDNSEAVVVWAAICDRLRSDLDCLTYLVTDNINPPLYSSFTEDMVMRILSTSNWCSFPIGTTVNMVLDEMLDRKLIKKSYYGQYEVVGKG